MGSHPKRGRPGGIEEIRAAIRKKLVKPWAQSRPTDDGPKPETSSSSSSSASSKK